MRRLRVFILILLSVWVALHCSTPLLYLSYPGQPEIPQKSANPSVRIPRCALAFTSQQTKLRAHVEFEHA
jgi:hypothetical protein